jgi:Tol biopolymer transport system component/DNA-binding winged helix-turn-helix (wHTH) protein
MPVGEKQTLRFGAFELDTLCGQLRKNGVGLKLQGQPIQVLQFLLEKPQQLVTREELRQRLWASDTFVDFDHSLNTAIKKLRQALGDEADTPRYVETLPKRGYRFIGELDGVEPNEEARTPAPVVVLPVEPTGSVRSPRTGRALSRKIAVVSLAALVVVVMLAALYSMLKAPAQPRIVGSHALTKTGYRKAREQARLVTDGKRIYFQERRPSGLATLQVGVSGGETSVLTSLNTGTGTLRDISRDASELLLSVFDAKANRSDTWVQPVPAGPPRLIVKDAEWSVWAPDGRGILFVRNGEQELYRVNLDGTDARLLAKFPRIADLATSPDGKRIRLAVRPTRSLWEAGSDGSGPHPVFSEHKDGWSAGTWSPDGRFYYFRSWDGERYNLWGVNEEQRWWKKWWRDKPPAVQLTFGPSTIGPPSASKDGRQIYATASEPHGELSAWDFESSVFVPFLSGISACYVDFSRDGQWIAYVSYPEGNLWRSRIDGSERMQLTAPTLAVINPRWSPDGKQILFMDWSGGDRRHMGGDVSRVYVVSADGGAPLLLLAGNPSPTDPNWSPDGNAIVYAVGGTGVSPVEIRTLDIRTLKSTRVPGSDGLWSPRWSPDGKYLVALATPNSRLMLYAFATQKWEELVSGPWVGWPSWSRDTRQIYFEEGGLLFRITVATHKKELIANPRGFRSAAYFMYNGGWFGVTPDGRPIATRDTATEEIYAFDLEFK